MKRAILEVTEADIEAARAARMFARVTGSNCPIAQALLRQYPEARAVTALPYTLYKGTGPNWDMAWPSPRMVRFMRQWDEERQAEPARFRVVWEKEEEEVSDSSPDK